MRRYNDYNYSDGEGISSDDDEMTQEEPEIFSLTCDEDSMGNPDQLEMESEPNIKSNPQGLENSADTSQSMDTAEPLREDVLDSELLDLLNAAPNTNKKYGKEIHHGLAIKFERWTTNGITDELYVKLKEKYLTPENAKLIDAPELNAEIEAAISDDHAQRDTSIKNKQRQMTRAISALGEAITLILSEKERNTTLLKLLLESSRIMCDCQHSVSLMRRRFLLNVLNEDVAKQLKNTKIDTFLFGKNLDEITGSAIPTNKSSAPPSESPKSKGPVTIKEPAVSQASKESHQPQVRLKKRLLSTLPPDVQQQYRGGKELVRESMRRRGYSRSSIDVVLNSISKVIKEFEAGYRKWFIFCNDSQLNVYDVSIPNIINFLKIAHNEGTRYRSLCQYRAALSYLSSENIYNNENIKRFFRDVLLGSKIPQPPPPSTHHESDIKTLVINYLGKWYPNDKLSLEKITKKLITMILYTTTHSIEAISKIKLSDIDRSVTGIKITFPKTKSKKKESLEPVLIVPFFDKKPEICLAKTLLDYLEMTEGFRNKTDSLFISYKRPHCQVKSLTLSTWVKATLTEIGIDTSELTVSSTRIDAKFEGTR